MRTSTWWFRQEGAQAFGIKGSVCAAYRQEAGAYEACGVLVKPLSELGGGGRAVMSAAFCDVSTSAAANCRLPCNLTKPGDGGAVHGGAAVSLYVSLVTAFCDRTFPG